MNQLQTDNLIALSLLLDEDIYVLNDLPQTVPEQTVTDGNTDIISQPNIELPRADDVIKPQPVPTITIPKIDKPTAPVKPINNGFDYLGENNKYILIIVNNENEKFLSKTDLDFLVKIMSAKKWVIEDVAIVNMAKYGRLDFEHLKAYFACSKIVTFGFNPAVLNIVGAVANKKSLYKNVAILGTWDLAKLQSDVAKKTVFWNQLKEF